MAMRIIGIDVGSENHVVAVVDADGRTLLKPTAISEDATGYGRLLELFARSMTMPSIGVKSSMARRSPSSFRLAAVWTSSRLPSNRSRSTAPKSLSLDDLRGEHAVTGDE